MCRTRPALCRWFSVEPAVGCVDRVLRLPSQLQLAAAIAGEDGRFTTETDTTSCRVTHSSWATLLSLGCERTVWHRIVARPPGSTSWPAKEDSVPAVPSKSHALRTPDIRRLPSCCNDQPHQRGRCDQSDERELRPSIVIRHPFSIEQRYSEATSPRYG